MTGPRVVSLLSSATEIAAALGLGPAELVGRSHECDHPDWVRDLPACSAPIIDTEADSRTIDRSVRQLVAQALSVYRVDGAALKALRADVILTQTQCEVCAVTPEDVAAAVGGLTGIDAEIVSLQPDCLDDVWADIGRVAMAVGRLKEGRDLVAKLRARMDAVARSAGRLARRPRIACVEWIDPLMAAGNWMPELVASAGGENMFGAAGRHSPWLEFNQLAAGDPDIVLVMPCGFDIARSMVEMPALTARPGWRDLRAVRNGDVYLTDGNQYFNRPGPRLVESLEILAEIFHPGAFRFGHREIGWRAYPAI
ncbi:MAG: cobalamin-binding protein [Alphaproteobacteria bacterium]|nr:cobalamin-binding protein [Alphaproteobacteria bacterium]